MSRSYTSFGNFALWVQKPPRLAVLDLSLAIKF
jgi:hypothetical protein